MRPLKCHVLALAAALLVGCGAAPERAVSRPRPVVVLMTDFGLEDDAVGLCRGAILAVAPDATVVDLCHRVPRFDVAAGARTIAEAPGVYPPGTVFVGVVDPGVGTSRRAIAARLADGSFLVGPDNGLLTEAIERHGPAEVRALENPAFFRPDPDPTFHGRDLFSPAGGHLAAGRPFAQAGPVVTDWVRLPRQVARREGDALLGAVVSIDEPFGNVWTDVPAALLAELGAAPGKARLSVQVGGRPALVVPLARTFGDVPEGSALAYLNSRGWLALALNMADFARTHGVERGTPVRVTLAE